MYKCVKNKKYFLSISTFPLSAKKISDVYLTGFRYWDSFDSKNHSIVIHRFRIILGVNKKTCCAEN